MSNGGINASYAAPGLWTALLGLLDEVGETDLQKRHIRNKADKADRRRATEQERVNGGDSQ
jgi:hypothetical protein